jgi:hypothetical protein
VETYTFLLVIVGVIQAFILGGTVWAIIRQTSSAQNSERAWVLIQRIGNPPENWRSGRIQGYSPGIVFVFNVYGKTPAKINQARFIFEPVSAKKGSMREPDLPEVPDYAKASPSTDIPRDGMTIPPESPLQLRIGRPMTDLEMNDLNEGKTILCAYGFIKYTDAFGRWRETRICFVYYIPSGGVIRSPDGREINPEGFRIGGPDAYNKAT